MDVGAEAELGKMFPSVTESPTFYHFLTDPLKTGGQTDFLMLKLLQINA